MELVAQAGIIRILTEKWSVPIVVPKEPGLDAFERFQSVIK
jgi:hypothetical protein